MNTTTPALISLRDLVKDSFDHTVTRPGYVGAVLVAFALVTLGGVVGMVFLGMALISGLMVSGWSVLSMVPLLLASGVLYILMFLAYLASGVALVRGSLMRQEKVGYWSHFAWALRKMWPISVVIVVVQLIATTGYALLFIPGAVFSLYALFSLFVYTQEERKGLQAVLRSTDIVQGQFWCLLWRLAAFTLVVVCSIAAPVVALSYLVALYYPAGSIVLIVCAFLLYPFAIVWGINGIALLFESAIARRPAEAYIPAAYKNLRLVYLAAAVIGVPLFIMWQLVLFYYG